MVLDLVVQIAFALAPEPHTHASPFWLRGLRIQLIASDDIRSWQRADFGMGVAILHPCK